MAPKVEAVVTDVRTAIVQQSFHPNAAGHAQFGRCLTESYGDGLTEGSCLRCGDGALHAVAGVTAATAQPTPVS